MRGTAYFRGNTFCTTSGLLINTAGGGVSTHDTTVTVNYCIRGKAYAKTAISGGATPTTDAVTGLTFPTLTANQGTVVVWCLNAAGTVGCIMGSIEDYTATVGTTYQFAKYPKFPAIPDTWCPFAYQMLYCDSSAGTIAFGTSNWDATGFTNAIVNILTLPNRLQIA